MLRRIGEWIDWNPWPFMILAVAVIVAVIFFVPEPPPEPPPAEVRCESEFQEQLLSELHRIADSLDRIADSLEVLEEHALEVRRMLELEPIERGGR